jgi:uncharacterized membrane-anchored protein YitT (DUF2179 family)
MGLIERIKDKDVFTRYLDFLLGLLIVSVAFNIFFLNHSIVYGVSGIGVMLNYLFGIDASLFTW